MGGNESKEQYKTDLKNIGEKEDKNGLEFGEDVIFTTKLLVDYSENEPDKSFKKICFLNKGRFCEVNLVQNILTENKYAMKTFNKTKNYSSEDEESIKKEFEILKSIDHPNVVKMIGFYSKKNACHLITELCNGGSLFKELLNNGPYSEKATAFIMFQIFSALNYCHKKNIIISGLSLDNILISDKNNGYPIIKLSYFGISKLAEKGAIQKNDIGFSYYIAPEILKKCYNEKCDIWSAGVIMYFLLSARPPFGGESNEEIISKIKIGNYDINCSPFSELSKNCIDLLQKLLDIQVFSRITSNDALNHPWFKENSSKVYFVKTKDEKSVDILIDNIKNYKKQNIIQKTALAYLIHNFSQMKEIVNACKLFYFFDKDQDGKINKNELYEGLKLKTNSNTLKNDIDVFFNNIDMDNNGFIEYEEFVRAAVNKKKFLNRNIIKYAFNYFDKDGSGTITFDEIRNVFEKNIIKNENIDEVLKKIMVEADLDLDGKITIEEFSKIMKQMIIQNL